MRESMTMLAITAAILWGAVAVLGIASYEPTTTKAIPICEDTCGACPPGFHRSCRWVYDADGRRSKRCFCYR